MFGKIDISYAEIKYFVSEWNYEDSANSINLFYEIESHNCTAEELGLTGDHTKIMPLREASKMGDYSLYDTLSFVCLNSDDMHIHGKNGSVKGRIISVAVLRCL